VQKGLEVQLKSKAADVAIIIENLEKEKAMVNEVKQVRFDHTLTSSVLC
jgi:hypothetical protein